MGQITTNQRARFTFCRSFMNLINECPAEQQGELALAILRYGMDGEKPSLQGKALEQFIYAKIELDRYWRLFRNGCSQPESHKRGGAPLGNKNAAKKKLIQYQDNTRTIPNQSQNNTKTTHLIYNTKDSISIESESCLSFVDEKYRDSFLRWLDYKRERKEDYKASSSVEAAYKKLVNLSGNDPVKAEQIVEQSIAFGWKGLFQLNEGSTGKAVGMKTGVVLHNNSISKYNAQKIW